MANDLSFQVFPAVERVNQLAACIPGHRVDGDVPALQVLFQGDVVRGIEYETLVARSGFAFGSGQGVFLPRFRVEKNGKLLADCLVSQRDHFLRRTADYDPVAIFYLEAQEFIPHRAADLINLHDS